MSRTYHITYSTWFDTRTELASVKVPASHTQKGSVVFDLLESCRLVGNMQTLVPAGSQLAPTSSIPHGRKKYILQRNNARKTLKKARHPSLSSNWVRSLLWLEEKKKAHPQRQTCFSQTHSYSNYSKKTFQQQHWGCTEICTGGAEMHVPSTFNLCTFTLGDMLWWHHHGTRRECFDMHLGCVKYLMSRLCPILPGIKFTEIWKNKEDPVSGTLH